MYVYRHAHRQAYSGKELTLVPLTRAATYSIEYLFIRLAREKVNAQRATSLVLFPDELHRTVPFQLYFSYLKSRAYALARFFFFHVGRSCSSPLFLRRRRHRTVILYSHSVPGEDVPCFFQSYRASSGFIKFFRANSVWIIASASFIKMVLYEFD